MTRLHSMIENQKKKSPNSSSTKEYPSCITATTAVPAEIMHRRLGHCGRDKL